MSGVATSALVDTGLALRRAFHDARRAWSSRASAAVVAACAAALLPLASPGWIRFDELASTLYLALAAAGLCFAVGLGGMPSLCQGAFVGIGAFAVAILGEGAGLPVEAAVPLAVAAAACAGLAAGIAGARLRPLLIAVSTWILTWFLALVLAAFPWISGGARGRLAPRGRLAGIELTPTAHYELALALLLLTSLGFWVLAKGSFGLRLAAASQRPAAAHALGVPIVRLRLGAFVASAAIGGLAGAFAVQLARVADPTRYSPFLSFKLLVAVLLGGSASALGGPAGIAVLAGLTLVAGWIGALEQIPTARFQPMLAALLVLAILSLGGEGLIPLVRGSIRKMRARGAEEERVSPPVGWVPRELPPVRSRPLEARGLRKSFGGVVAVNDLDLKFDPATISAVIGPNGSGKTTALRLLGGTLAADRGKLTFGDRDITTAPVAARVELGIVRTLQQNAVFPDLTVLDSVLVGAAFRSRYAGAFRTVFSTPGAREEAVERREKALTLLASVGLEGAAGLPAERLSNVDQRVLMLACAVATEPRVLLADEPSAGASAADLPRLAGVLLALRERGMTVVVVEHNLRLVRLVADEAVVLASGRMIAAGSTDDVARDELVRRLYLGRQLL